MLWAQAKGFYASILAPETVCAEKRELVCNTVYLMY